MNLYFDIETIPLENTKKIYNKEILEHYKDYINFKEEFNMIYCISVWVNTKEKWFYTKTFSSEWNLEKEKEVIESFFNIIYTQEKKKTKKQKQINFIWYNIKWFDIPFILKRALFHWIRIPNKLKFYKQKPREIDYIIDLLEIYKTIWFWNKSINLETLTLFLWLTNPKDNESGIKWSEVAKFVKEWKWKEVEKYCEKDVKACFDICDKFVKLNVI